MIQETLLEFIEKSIELEYNYMIIRSERILETNHKDNIKSLTLNEEKLILICDMIMEEITQTIIPYEEIFKKLIIFKKNFNFFL